MSSGKYAKFSGLIASISIKSEPCDLCLNRRAMFFKIFQLDLESLLYFRLYPLCIISCVDPTREKNVVLVVSPLINLMKDQVSRLNSRGRNLNKPRNITQ